MKDNQLAILPQGDISLNDMATALAKSGFFSEIKDAAQVVGARTTRPRRDAERTGEALSGEQTRVGIIVARRIEGEVRREWRRGNRVEERRHGNRRIDDVDVRVAAPDRSGRERAVCRGGYARDHVGGGSATRGTGLPEYQNGRRIGSQSEPSQRKPTGDDRRRKFRLQQIKHKSPEHSGCRREQLPDVLMHKAC